MDKKFDDFAKKVTGWIGSGSSLIFHSLFFVAIFALRFFGYSSEDVLLILTTIVSLEAIYLSILIQMTVNQQGKELEEVSEELEEVSGDIEEIQKDVGEIQEDVEGIQEDIEDIEEDIEEESKRRKTN